MSDQHEYDLVVIGSGPAGEKGAVQAAYFGKKVAVVERAEHLGGAGINTGTIPSKTLRETALYFSGLLQRGLYGIDYSLREGLTVREFMHREHVVVRNERDQVRHNLERHHVEVVWGEASIADAHTVRVRLRDGGERDLRTEVVLIATGSSPYHVPGVPFDHHRVHDSDSILRMDRIPRTMVVVGGGVIGCEYASVFTVLGAQVTLVEGRSRLLPFVDGEIAGRLRHQLETLGMRFVFDDRVATLVVRDDRAIVTTQAGTTLECDTVLYASGRQSNVEALALEAVGITLGEHGLIPVDDQYQTAAPNIYAAGDVIGFPALASTSMEQARVAMVHAFGLRYKEQVSPVLPLAVYTVPEISMVGLTEDECTAKNVPHLVGRALYEASARGQIIGDTSGMFKLVFAPEDKKLLGAHIIGEMASELIHLGAQVMAVGGTIDSFIRAVYNYPTLSDSYKYAAYDGLGAWERWRAARA
ncbi:MAG: Si-specific NAD(P)(+) transhydrogenase [Acidobacteriota bacterium]